MNGSDGLSLLILDCDGVLVDSEGLLLDVREEMLEELGIPIGRAELVERFTGTPHREFSSEIERRLGGAVPEGWDAEYERRCRGRFETALTPVPGIVAALDAIELPTCVASSGSHEKMRLTLGITGLLPRFEGHLFSATDVARGKPYPDLFLHAAEQMGFQPSRCVVVEDSAAGVDAGLAAGMAVVAYSGSVTPRDRLDRNGVLVIEDMSELPTAVNRSIAT